MEPVLFFYAKPWNSATIDLSSVCWSVVCNWSLFDYILPMSMMLSKTYDALISAGAPEEKAREAAEELASYDNRFANLETDMKIVKMMLALILAGIASLIVKAFFV